MILASYSLSGQAFAGFPFVGEMLAANSTLNLRSVGDPEGSVITTIPPGEQFELLICAVPSGWCKVTFNGQVGWLSGELVDVTFQGQPTTLTGAYAQHWATLMAPPKAIAADTGITQIVAWGDSLTAGAGNTEGSYTDLLRAKHPTIRFDNQGVGGQKSDEVAARMLKSYVGPNTAVLIWAGRNNYKDPDQVLADIQAMVAHVGNDNYLVGSVLPGGDANEKLGRPGGIQIARINNALREKYGDRFVDILPKLIAGGDPVADSEYITGGLVPKSLRVDGQHLNDGGYAIVAAEWDAAIQRMGWLSDSSATVED